MALATLGARDPSRFLFLFRGDVSFLVEVRGRLLFVDHEVAAVEVLDALSDWSVQAEVIVDAPCPSGSKKDAAGPLEDGDRGESHGGGRGREDLLGAWSKVTLALTAAGGVEDEEEVVAGSTRELAMPAFPLLKGVNALLNQSSKTLTATNRHILGG